MSGSRLDLDLLRTERCVAIIRGRSMEHLPAAAQTLAESGIGILEFPLTTPGVLSMLPGVVSALAGQALVGVGSVTDLDEAEAARNAGAAFLVTPNVNLDVIKAARTWDLPILAGAFTPTEIVSAWKAGATAVKLFPGSLGGPGYLSELVNGPFPHIPIIPTGGVKLEEVRSYLDAGATAFGMGGSLLGTAPNGGALGELRERARQFRAAVA